MPRHGEPVAHGGELADGVVEVVGFGRQQLAVDARAPVGGEHEGDLVEREARDATQGDEGEAVEHFGGKESVQASTTDGCDEPLLLVVPQC